MLLLLFSRVWVGLVGTIALMNAAQCFINEDYPKARLYTVLPEQASPLLSRMFGVWTLLAAIIRLAFALTPPNKSIWLVTLLSFVLALLHFTTEMFVYKTATTSFATISPLVVSSISIIWLIAVLPSLNSPIETGRPENKSKKI